MGLSWREALETHLMGRLSTVTYAASWRYPDRRGIEWPGTRGEAVEFTDVVLAVEDLAFTKGFAEGLATLSRALNRGDGRPHLHLVMWEGLGVAWMVSALRKVKFVVEKLIQRASATPLPVLCVGRNYDDVISEPLEDALTRELLQIRQEVTEIVPNIMGTLALGIVPEESSKLQAILRSCEWDVITVRE